MFREYISVGDVNLSTPCFFSSSLGDYRPQIKMHGLPHRHLCLRPAGCWDHRPRPWGQVSAYHPFFWAWPKPFNSRQQYSLILTFPISTFHCLSWLKSFNPVQEKTIKYNLYRTKGAVIIPEKDFSKCTYIQVKVVWINYPLIAVSRMWFEVSWL